MVAGPTPATPTPPRPRSTAAPTLEGVAPALNYYSGTFTNVSQLSGLTPLNAAPSTAGSYTAEAFFAGSTDYASGSALADFSISQIVPTVSVTDAGGPYIGQSYPASATVNGGATLEAVGPTLTYFSGTFSNVGQLPAKGGSASPPSVAGNYTVAAIFPGSTDYTSASSLATFTILRIAPTLSVLDAGGAYTNQTYPAADTVNGGATLEGVAPSLSYYSGTFTNASQLSAVKPLSGAPSAAGNYTVEEFFTGSTDYTSGSALANFTISQLRPRSV